MPESVAFQLGEALKERGWTLSVAETTTGGLICSRIVDVPGSSAWFERGIVAYSKASKELVGVDDVFLAANGAVSAETASAMAQGLRALSNTTLGIAETGIAGPIRGRSPKPLGTAFIALSHPGGCLCEQDVYEGNRTEIRSCIADRALGMALKFLRSGG